MFQKLLLLYFRCEIGRDMVRQPKNCQKKGGDLVSIENKAEWSFLNNEIQKRCIGKPNEWHIGLHKVNGDWKWVSGSKLNIKKWQTTAGTPSGGGDKVVMSRDFTAKNARAF